MRDAKLKTAFVGVGKGGLAGFVRGGGRFEEAPGCDGHKEF
jgi:hypothetical protein